MVELLNKHLLTKEAGTGGRSRAVLPKEFSEMMDILNLCSLTQEAHTRGTYHYGTCYQASITEQLTFFGGGAGD